MSHYYSGIGSRETPENILGVMEDAAFRLARLGWVLRSGKAKGADAAFQRGMQRYSAEHHNVPKEKLAEIYIPWSGFKGDNDLLDDWDVALNNIDRIFPDQVSQRFELMKQVHPAAEYMRDNKRGAFALHSRNVHQLMGPNLSEPRLSSFVLYYANEDKNGNPKGGTATAVKLAKMNGIRTLNLLTQEGHGKLAMFLTSMEAKYADRIKVSE